MSLSLLKALFSGRPKSAAIAKDRLQLIIARERSDPNAADWLPRLQKDILEAIARYVPVDPAAVKVHMERGDNLDVLEINIVVPERGASAAR
jgi:cell division topological specificity factor